MTPAVLTLVLTAAVLHAAWNLLAKRAQAADTVAFVWLTTVLSAALYLPVVAVWLIVVPLRQPVTALGIAFIAGTAVIHSAYFLLLQRGYRAGDLSLVYPLARGTGPLLASVAAVLFMGERPGIVGSLGIAAIVGGIFVATGATLHVRRARVSLGYGLATGATIAAYTLWDKHAVSALAIVPVVYEVGHNCVQTVLMAPLAWSSARRRAALGPTWRAYRTELLGVAVLSPLGYILVLFALVVAPVSLVAPAREVSIVFGALLGARLFGEGDGRRRVAGALLILAGIVALARG
ncbi:MAG: DMT family transporter [Candidatus Eremiobacteraeota bacterium]|nr:DMT family transporter [Candidatus Eremiobacteraeota bacterium]